MPGWGVALAAVGAVALVVVLLDRAVAHGWFDGVRLTVRSGREPGEGAAGGGFLGELVEIFQPNRQHLVAEVERQRMDIVREGDAAPPGPDERPGRHPLAPGDNKPTVP
ncbi:hypothetical protein Cfla_2124 [Cellulomonas flavigena DSM 20109]|uniref:Uncharacterized protein n=1 Tax=Cellulomonas flavigena (strain ATCC 482 / DSM 20109 / BCRC 11376 / JCM 18109 / NBRC 3775 / NCIMB 8073 / NRS 134) TaxID=446466 RepID=D5UFZ6_CELFN|nr:DUF6191 domain-containing protein [Cellulomonas flavigena]ADG75019.1 hypothetical protein Cfla_2124 [Cellulomonas flavigena DSM 20109]